MADQIATRYGILDKDISNAALQTIVLTTADAIDALDEAHLWLRRMGVPDTHAGHHTPRQRWEQLLHNLFPASIILVDPHGSASPDLVKLPAGSDEDERAVRRLLKQAAAFLLDETATLEDAVDLSQHWTSPDPARADEGLNTAETLLARATRASQALLDHAESGRWRDLLATHAPEPPAPEPTLPEQAQHTGLEFRVLEPLMIADDRPAEDRLGIKFRAGLLAPLRVSMVGACSAGKSRLLTDILRRHWHDIELTRHERAAAQTRALALACAMLESVPYGHVFAVAARLSDNNAWRVAESFRQWRSAGYRNLPTDNALTDLWACTNRYVARFDCLADPPIAGRTPVNLRTTSAIRDGRHRSGAARTLHDARQFHGVAPWDDLVVPSWRGQPAWQLLDVSGAAHPPPTWSRPETNEMFAMSRQLLAAATQLVAADGAARLSAVSMLEDFGQANPSQRQTVVNVLCSYLRMPPDVEHAVNEQRVRGAVQAALAGHLRPGTNPAHPPAAYWPEIDLDLTDAVLTDLDLTGCHAHSARFTRAHFRGNTSFTNVRFANAVFDDAEFEGDVLFEQVVFADDTRFRRTTFQRAAVFENASFHGDVRFDAARFAGTAVFTGSMFDEDVRFSETEFSGDAVFDQVTFTGLARFEQARFFNGARFHETRFHHDQDNRVRVWDLGAVLLEREPCWVRTDIPAAIAPQRVWPNGWTVQPTLDQPTGGHDARWGRLVPAQQPLPHPELSAS